MSPWSSEEGSWALEETRVWFYPSLELQLLEDSKSWFRALIQDREPSVKEPEISVQGRQWVEKKQPGGRE